MELWWRAHLPGRPCPAGALGDQQADKRPTVDCRWCMAWFGEGDGDGQAHTDCPHPPPSPIDTHDSTATEESPVVGLEAGSWGSRLYRLQLGYSIKV